MTFDNFLHQCTMCGGNWTSMFLTGIKAVAPELYEALPDKNYSFDEVCFIVNHLCYDRPHTPFHVTLDGDLVEHTIEGKFNFRKATEEEIASYYNK